MTSCRADRVPPGKLLPAHVRVAIVGTGFAGLGTAIKLEQAGETDFVVLERADDVGGTWRDNTYPGLCLRRAEPPVLVLVRAEPGLARTPSRGSREILDYLQRRAPATAACCRTSASAPS